ncbi:hypothetical protein Clacol_004200 [Clathrus columnatus]|uniref:BTB domain-containing protein n=1 Tax=Clathrus columnatus TaxID=1419009 RepID=A0AAV5A6R9_9AGAM|nr:hypothetical protein Clacol_004200 [Clathrus columnatus]
MAQNKESWQEHSDFYFPDGTIFLLAESTLFRVYAKLLAMHSDVFRDLMGSSPKPKNAGTYDGYPLIRLEDKSEDVACFLKVTMGLWDSTLSYSMVSSLLRFSSKHMAHSIRKQVIEKFKHVIPQSFGTTHDRKKIHLDADDTRIALLGWKTLCQMTHENRRAAINSKVYQIYCLTDYCRTTTSLAWTERASRTFPSEAMEEQETLGSPCQPCVTAWLKEEKKGRAKVWLQLPGIFGLPDWETLKREEEL